MGHVYTITPTTRGEPSQSTKHLAYFNMLEWEFCFGTLSDNIDLAESCIKACANSIITSCLDEVNTLEWHSRGKLKDTLTIISKSPFQRIKHSEAISLLKTIHQGQPFNDEPKFTDDLSGAHERALVSHFGRPVVVTNYPKDIKAFYMPVVFSEEHDGTMIEYVDCFDLLMDIGEVVGGSSRIWDADVLVKNMRDRGMDLKQLDWYIDLRKYGSVPHGGAGLGIERLVASLTGMANVKDCISFPITVHHCVY